MNQDASGKRSGDKDCGAEALAMLGAGSEEGMSEEIFSGRGGMRNMVGLRLLIAALLIMILAQAGQAGDWPMQGHDAAHTGVADEVVEPPLELVWKYTTGAYNPGLVISRGIVYAVSWDNNVYALDATNGNLKWKYITGD